MLTLFACPKPFTDPHIRLIQRNALASWLALTPRPEVVLFGDEEGIAETCREFGVRHIPKVKRNALGTPLLNDVFQNAERMTSEPLLCYVNADIILMSDFTDAIRVCKKRRSAWMMGGRPWDLSIRYQLAIVDDWQTSLGQAARAGGVLRWAGACDYFTFTKGLWSDLPAMALGRSYFDLALLYLARKRGAALIDATEVVTAVHQSHTYAAHLSGEGYTDNPEAMDNVRLAGGWEHIYTWENATHRVTAGGLRRYWPGTLRRWGHFSPTMRAIDTRLWYPALALTKPMRHVLGLKRSTFLELPTRIRRFVGG